MSPRKITIHIDQVSQTGVRMSQADLSAAIQRHLGTLLYSQPNAGPTPDPRGIAVVSGGTVTTGQGMETNVGQAVARAAMGVLKP